MNAFYAILAITGWALTLPTLGVLAYLRRGKNQKLKPPRIPLGPS